MVGARQWQQGEARELLDPVAVEAPLEVRVGSQSIAVIMRTPGDDIELALGFLATEGLISGLDDIRRIAYWQDADGNFAENVITFSTANEIRVAPDRQRAFYAASSCGMCGKASIDAAMRLAPPLSSRARILPSVLYALPEKLRAAQEIFDRTGGLHAAGLFDYSGSLIALREDVGRHNAVDKLVGLAMLNRSLPLHDRILMLSGRVSYEIIQKALVARIPLIAAISAPSSLAIGTARACNIALVGFLRDGRLNDI